MLSLHGLIPSSILNYHVSNYLLLFVRNTSKKALTNDLIEGLEKDLERLKRFEENLRIRKLRTMKGGDKIINETDDDRYKAKIENLHQDVEGRGAHIIHADLERL